MQNPHVHIPYHKVGDYLPLLRSHKFNLEIFFSPDSLDTICSDDIGSLKDRLDYSPALCIHAPFMDLSPGAVDSKIRRVTMERFSQIFSIAEDLKPRSIVFHSGYEKWKYALRVDLWLERSLETWRALIGRAENLGIVMAIENIFEEEPMNLKMLIEGMGSDNFGICFDTGHCNLFTTVPLQQWITELGPYIVQFHLHDNDRRADAHLPIGDGTFDFNTLFSSLGPREYIYTIEAHTPEGVMKSMARLAEYTAPR